MLKFFVFPRKNDSNPYIYNLTKSLELRYNLVEESIIEKKTPPILGLFRSSFVADVFVVNWLESVAFSKFSYLQTILAYLSICIIKFRRKKIVWIFHNIHPHQGVNKKSTIISSLLFNKSDLIIAHSQEAAIYAKNHAKHKVIYRCHPFSKLSYTKLKNIPKVDVLYWGEIYEYKGIDKFIEFLNERNTDLRVHIIGRCKSEKLYNIIRKNCNNYITYDDKFASIDLIASYIANSKYVVFPYVGDSISSSGAVIDTIVLGGNVVGPHKGTFVDLAKENLCLTYETYDDLLQILQSDYVVNQDAISDFISDKEWCNMGHFIELNLK